MLSKDNKKFMIYIGMLYLAIFLSYKIPHDSRSLVEIIIKPIRDGSSVFYPSSFLSLALFLVGIFGFINLERFAKRSKFLIFLLMIMLFLPFMKWTIDISRTTYYSLLQDNLNAVDIEDSHISFNGDNDKLTLTAMFTLVDYGNSQKKFKCRIHLPKTLSKLTGVEVYELQTIYMTNGKRMKMNITETFDLYLKDNASLNNISRSEWYNEDTIYELYNDKEAVRIIDYGYSLDHQKDQLN